MQAFLLAGGLVPLAAMIGALYAAARLRSTAAADGAPRSHR